MRAMPLVTLVERPILWIASSIMSLLFLLSVFWPLTAVSSLRASRTSWLRLFKARVLKPFAFFELLKSLACVYPLSVIVEIVAPDKLPFTFTIRLPLYTLSLLIFVIYLFFLCKYLEALKAFVNESLLKS